MKTKLLTLKSLALAAMLLSAAAANAGITVYTSQSAFMSATTAPGVDTYNDLSVQFYNSPMARTAGAYSYTVSAENGLYGAGVAGDAWLSTNSRGSAMVFSNFSSGANAFGGNFFGSDISGLFVPGTSVVLTAQDGTSLTYQIDNTTTSSFLGFVSSSTLTSVSLSSVGTYWPTANNVTLAMAAAVPEPETYAMLLVGMSLLGVAARRRR
jgi:hypothetical protein